MNESRFSYVLPISMLWYSRFSFSNLRSANSCMFSYDNQQSISLFLALYDIQPVYTVNVRYVYTQVLAIGKKILSQINEINHG